MHYRLDYCSCDPYNNHYSLYCPDLNLSDVCISLVHTIIVQTRAKYDHRITYSGDLPKHAYGQGVIACGSTLMGNDSVMIAQSVFDSGRKGNSSSVCGHKIRAQGSATNGGSGSNGVIVKSGKMSLTVVGYCKYTALTQPCDRNSRIDQ